MIDGYHHATPMQVRWGDMDALGHVNNAVYLTYLEQARLTYIHDLGLWAGDQANPGLIMAKVVLDYKLPLLARDQVVVYTRTARLGNRSLDTEQIIARQGADSAAIAATATITLVVYDYHAQQSVPIPDPWRARLSEYDGLKP